MWLVSGFFNFLHGWHDDFGSEESSRQKSRSKNIAFAISQTNESNHPVTKFCRSTEIISSPALLPRVMRFAFNGDQGHVAIITTGSLTGIFTVGCWALSETDRSRGVLVSSRVRKITVST